MRIGLPFVAAFALGLAPRFAAAQPSLHAGVGVGASVQPVASVAAHDTAELGPAFVQVEAGGSLGPMGSIAHAAHLAFLGGFTEGPQVGIMPSYLLYRRSSLRFAQLARIGFPLVLVPETAYGVEIGAGVVYFFRAGIGVLAELDVDFYRGIDNEISIGGHVGPFFSYEILPR